MQEIYNFLHSHNIDYKRFDHEAIFTVEEAAAVEKDIPGIKAKTLLVFGEKTRKLYLISIEGHKKLEQKVIKAVAGERVRFGTADDLERCLRVTPGSVSPLGLIFDEEREIQMYLVGQDITMSEFVTWHPNDNTQTLVFTQAEFQKILSLLPHSTAILE